MTTVMEKFNRQQRLIQVNEPHESEIHGARGQEIKRQKSADQQFRLGNDERRVYSTVHSCYLPFFYIPYTTAFV